VWTKKENASQPRFPSQGELDSIAARWRWKKSKHVRRGMKWHLLITAILAAIFLMTFACGDDDDDEDRGGDYVPSEDDDDAESDDDDDTSGVFSCDGDVCIDQLSGLTWQNDDGCCDRYSWEEAKDYCQNLVLGGYDDWHLPSIDELRSLIRGCSQIETGGSCSITDECSNNFDCWDASCIGCTDIPGPGPDGQFWPAVLGGDGHNDASWSSTKSSDNFAWYVHFDLGYVNMNVSELFVVRPVRCVR
jgi:uncharacterized protein (TIGR02145 family)